MPRPALDKSGIDSKEPRDKSTVYIPGAHRARLEERWSAERAASQTPKDFPGFGTWMGDLLALIAIGEEKEPELPAQPDGFHQETVVVADSVFIADRIFEQLRPELSDVLRRSTFKALGNIGQETKEELGQAMVGAVERGMSGMASAAAEHAAKMATLALIPEIRKLTAAVNALSAPAEIYEGTTH